MRMAVRMMPAARTIANKKRQEDVLPDIVNAALQVPDSGKLYNTMRHDEYDVDEVGGEEVVRSVDDSK